MAITKEQATHGTRVQIPTRKTYYDDDHVNTSGVIKLAKDLKRDYLVIICCEDAVDGRTDKVTVGLKKNDSGDHFTLQDLHLY